MGLFKKSSKSRSASNKVKPNDLSDITWESLFKDIQVDDQQKAEEFWQIVTSFFIPDNINPSKFRANSIELIRSPLIDQLLEADDTAERTQSVQRLLDVGNRPIGYPEWFLAGYPDVVIWAANMFSPIRVSRNEIDENLFRRVFGSIRNKNEMLDGDGFIKHRYLRELIKAYRENTRRNLECIK